MNTEMDRIAFLLNGEFVEIDEWGGRPLLDFLREDRGLTGTKEGCREGDCGACAVLVGEFVDSGGTGSRELASRLPRYRAHPSCLMSVGELAGRHLVTIEGLAAGAEAAALESGLTPVMRALIEQNGSQCGFCSPGFVISLTAWLLEGERLPEGDTLPEVIQYSEAGALTAIEGNLCRCTGYASIRRAASALIAEFNGLPFDPIQRIEALAEAGVVPTSLARFARGAIAIAAVSRPRRSTPPVATSPLILGGGSDSYVRNPHPGSGAAPLYTRLDPALTSIEVAGGEILVGAAVSVRDFFSSRLVRDAVPGIEGFEGGFASLLVRNRATLGGNIANASPVADMTAILLALGVEVELVGIDDRSASRRIPLERLFLGYKKLDLRSGELIAAFRFPRLEKNEAFNFEKLSKRENLDIAAVNTALRIWLTEDRGTIAGARLSAGGIAATPRLLHKASAFMEGRKADAETAGEAARIAAAEISPIDDVRGSAAYRRLALERLVLAHFARLFPECEEGIAEGLTVGLAGARRGG